MHTRRVGPEVKDEEVIMMKPQLKGSYTEYYVSTNAPKLRKPMDVKQIILEEVADRYGRG